MNLGNEIKRDSCPEKYYKSKGFAKDVLPILIPLAVIGIISGILMGTSGAGIIITLVIEALFVGLGTAFLLIFISGSKKRLSQQHISVCDNGICGVCPLSGSKNRRFEHAYSEITKISTKGDRLVIYTEKGNVSVTVSDADATAALIDSKITEILEKQN
ncbi:MAG: hypothetical protein IJN17_00665 [Clostridia bacterium]|nr:hypothetical protein [Clostridia bacterium]